MTREEINRGVNAMLNQTLMIIDKHKAEMAIIDENKNEEEYEYE